MENRVHIRLVSSKKPADQRRVVKYRVYFKTKSTTMTPQRKCLPFTLPTTRKRVYRRLTPFGFCPAPNLISGLLITRWYFVTSEHETKEVLFAMNGSKGAHENELRLPNKWHLFDCGNFFNRLTIQFHMLRPTCFSYLMNQSVRFGQCD